MSKTLADYIWSYLEDDEVALSPSDSVALFTDLA